MRSATESAWQRVCVRWCRAVQCSAVQCIASLELLEVVDVESLWVEGLSDEIDAPEVVALQQLRKRLTVVFDENS